MEVHKEENWPSLCDSDSDIVSTDSDSENFESDFSDFDVLEMDGNNFHFLNKFQNPIYGNAVTQWTVCNYGI